MIQDLTIFTIDMMNVMICLYNSGKISYEDFLKHSGIKIRFLRDNIESAFFDKQDLIKSILNEYDRIITSKNIH